MVTDGSRDRENRLTHTAEVILHIKSNGEDYYIVLPGNSCEAITTDQQLGRTLAYDMGDGSPAHHMPNGAKVYATCPCCTTHPLTPLDIESYSEQPECCYLVNGQWLCY